MNATRTKDACLKSVQAEQRARPLVRHAYQAWCILDNGRGECSPVDVSDVGTLSGALAKVPLIHKQHVMIRETDTMTGKSVEHLYAVKARKQWVRAEDGTTRNVAVPYADRLFSMARNGEMPAEPWSWSPGADVVGIDRNEVRA